MVVIDNNNIDENGFVTDDWNIDDRNEGRWNRYEKEEDAQNVQWKNNSSISMIK